MEYYWQLFLKDGEIIELPPSAVPVIRKHMAARDAINLRTRSIPFSEIKEFRQSSKPFGVPLLEAAAQAFKEPVLTEDGMAVRYVKKSVTTQEYAKHYSHIPAYKNLGSDGNMVMVAFRIPIHEIDTSRMSYCSQQEEEKLNGFN